MPPAHPPLRIPVLRVRPPAPGVAALPLPTRATPGSAGLDLPADISEDLTLAVGARALVPTGFAVALPEGWEGQVRPRSGLALRHGLTVLNAPGTIDSDYRGEIKVLLVNLGQEPVTLRRGDRIAQLVVAAVAPSELCECLALPDSGRGAAGFGHSGR